MATYAITTISPVTYAKVTPLIPPTIPGTSGDDDLYGSAAGETIQGKAGNDHLYGLGGDDILHGGSGADVMAGGTGNDIYYVDNLYDVVWEWGGQGIDTIYASVGIRLPDGVENLILEGDAGPGIGNSLDNIITANPFDNVLHGAEGNDTLHGGIGSDILLGGTGNDQLYGGTQRDLLNGQTGRDMLTGGAGDDLFVWHAIEDMAMSVGNADVVTDFSFAEGDVIYVPAIDADIYAADNQAFRFIGQAAFSGTPGEINYLHSGGNTILQFQTGMSPDVEGVIVLTGIHTPQASWFVL